MLRHDHVARCRVTNCARMDGEAWLGGFEEIYCASFGDGRAVRLDTDMSVKVSNGLQHARVRVGVVDAIVAVWLFQLTSEKLRSQLTVFVRVNLSAMQCDEGQLGVLAISTREAVAS